MRARDDEWDLHLEGFPEATFYHSRMWWRILDASFRGLTDESYWIEEEKRRAAVPIHCWNRLGGLLSTRHSSFPFLYGGPVPRHINGRDLFGEPLARLSGGTRSFRILSNPFAPGPVECPRGVLRRTDSTHILLLPSNYDDYWAKHLTTAKRNDVRRLTKKGVGIRTGGSLQEISSVYALYESSFQRWGARPSFVYPLGFYRALIQHGHEHIRLYLAEYEDRIIGGAFVVRWNGHVHYHAGYFDHSARSLRPNVLLQERIIRDAITDGYCDYDFLPSGGNPGVESFKESFGGVRTEIDRYEYSGPLHRLRDRFQRRSQR